MTVFPLHRLALLILLLGARGASAAPPVPDTMAERVSPCTTCHGKEGRATNQGYFPRIAGKPAGYLYNQLVNFREGRRSYALMTYLVDHLSDAYLREMADHFAALDLPYPPPQTVGAAPALLARGRALVEQGDPARRIPPCSACHGAASTGVQPAIPGLLGLPRDYLNGQLGAWRTGQRRATPPDCMGQVARSLSVDDINAASTWLSSQPLPADTRPAASLSKPLPIECGGLKP
jgi:cytochrome c553